MIRLLLLAAPKQLGLGKLRDLFETCFAPSEVTAWIDKLEEQDIVHGPYFEIIDVIYDLQKTDREPPSTSVVRMKLNDKIHSSFSTSQVTSFIEILCGIIPGHIHIDPEKKVSVENSPEVIKKVIGRAISTDIPVTMREIYSSMFK
jgi:hypothetical protein